MNTLADIVDTLRWLCHAAAIMAALWVGGSTLNAGTVTVLILAIAAADFLAARGLRFVADWLTSTTHV